MIYHNPFPPDKKKSFQEFISDIKDSSIIDCLYEVYKELFLKKSIIAYSGGKDSSLLLYLYYYLVKKKNIPVPILFHLNHTIRDNYAQEFQIERFMNSTLSKVIYKKKNIPMLAKKLKKSLEATGRIIRYKYLQKIANKENAIIVTGHHTNDYLESVLINFIRGGGLSSLRTLEFFNSNLFRPLVLLKASERNDLAREINFPIFDDESNESRDYLRNRIRQDVMPPLLREGLDTHKLYFNFHESELTFREVKTKRSTFYKINKLGMEEFSLFQLKTIIDLYLNVSKCHPIQKKILIEIYKNIQNKKIVLQENSEVIFWKSPASDFYIINKKSSCLEFASLENGILTWNDKNLSIDLSYSIEKVKEGMKIQRNGKHKELSELFREREIPIPVRNFFPVCMQNSKLRFLPFSLWDDKIKDYYGD
jgi:tRNA(Ile)-lysidine synthase